MGKKFSRWAVALAALTGLSSAAAAQSGGQQLGKVHFATTCKPEAQKLFDRGMLYQHSFWYRASKQTFEDVIKLDAACAIAHWGVGMSLLNNPFSPPPAAHLPEGLAALQKGKGLAAKSSEREKALIDALLAFYTGHDKADHRARVQAYLKAMEGVATRFPDDDEAQIFYALALNVGATPGDKTYASQLKAAEILEKIYKRQPEHPGVSHYLIHTYDYPPIAEKGLEAARRYAKIAAAAPHAQHMPSHIFTRVGYWKESIASNAESARIAKLDKEADDQLHGMDYLVYAHLQLAQDKKAKAVADEVLAVEFKRNAGAYGRAAAQARYMVERGDWKGAAALPVQASDWAYADAVTHFARALGAARSGDAAAAKPDFAKLSQLRDKLRQARDAYWAEQVDIQWQVANAWVLAAEGKHAEALKLLTAAADAEDKTDKHPITPGPLAPARELLGSMLLTRGMANEALQAFEATLKKEPNRLAATIGAAQAAKAVGDAAKTRDYALKVQTLTREADTRRPDVETVLAALKPVAAPPPAARKKVRLVRKAPKPQAQPRPRVTTLPSWSR
jgi:tetratricopeptide (TPR) repeat protein